MLIITWQPEPKSTSCIATLELHFEPRWTHSFPDGSLPHIQAFFFQAGNVKLMINACSFSSTVCQWMLKYSMCGHVFVSMCLCVLWSMFPMFVFESVCACFSACVCVCSGVCVFGSVPQPHAASRHKLQSQTKLETLGFWMAFISIGLL